MSRKDKDFDLEKINELVALMETHNLAEIEIIHGGDKVLLRRAGTQTGAISGLGVGQPSPKNSGPDKDLEVIKSPTPGTFYGGLSPDSNPFVEVGSTVTPQTPVCIIEAMKVMNEIKAETTGQIVEILAKNGQAVEYGQPLFKVKPEQ